MDLENDIADFLGAESAISYSQGFSTISSVIPAFCIIRGAHGSVFQLFLACFPFCFCFVFTARKQKLAVKTSEK